MKTMKELRAAIDAVDDELVAVLNRRFALTDEVRELKRREGLPAVDAAREREIFARVLASVPAGKRDTVYGVYERLFNGSRGVIETIARGICVVDGKVLLCRAKGSPTTYLPGGHIEFGETARQALVREVREELGVESSAGRFLGAVENSFLQHGESHAEINLVYALELSVPDPLSVIKAQEDWIGFEWRELSDLASARLLPVEMFDLVRGRI